MRHLGAKPARRGTTVARVLLCACLFGMLACVRPCPAWAEAPSIDVPSDGASVDVDAPGTFSVYFGHNVCADSVYDDNAAHFYLVDEDGNDADLTVSRNYAGAAPDEGNEDPTGQRRIIYAQAANLKPGTTYTFGVTAGVRSSGGHEYTAASVTFTTTGEKETEDDPPTEPPSESTPVVPGTGDGDGVGDGSGSGEGGGTALTGSGSSAGDGEAAEEASGLAGEESETHESEAVAEPLDGGYGIALAKGAQASKGGTVYALGADGALGGGGSGDQVELVVQTDTVMPWIVVLLAALIAFAVGAARRRVSWQRHMHGNIQKAR